MNDGLDTTLLLPDLGERPSAQYRTSPYTVREYAALPYAQRRAVDAVCDKQLGLVFSFHPHRSGHPYRLGQLPNALGHAA